MFTSADMRRKPDGRFGKLALLAFLQIEEDLIFEKAAAGQNLDELFLNVTDFKFAGGFDKGRP